MSDWATVANAAGGIVGGASALGMFLYHVLNSSKRQGALEQQVNTIDKVLFADGVVSTLTDIREKCVKMEDCPKKLEDVDSKIDKFSVDMTKDFSEFKGEMKATVNLLLQQRGKDNG